MLEWIHQGEATPPTPNCVPLEGPEILLGEGGTSTEEQADGHCPGCSVQPGDVLVEMVQSPVNLQWAFQGPTAVSPGKVCVAAGWEW